MAGVIPRCPALVLCGRVERDAATRNPTLVGVFQVIEVASFPAGTRPFAVWIQLTNGHGAIGMQVRIAHVRPDHFEDEPVATLEFTRNFADPRVVHEHVGRFENGLYLEQAGDYLVTLTANGIEVARTYLRASVKT